MINRKEIRTAKANLVANIGKIFKTRYGNVIVFPHPAYALRGVDVYIPITELKEILRYTIEEVKYEEKSRI